MDESLMRPPLLPPFTGDEPLRGVDATVLDFWRWALGDLRMNNSRGHLVEFLVAKAVEAEDPMRVEWGSSDVLAPDGTRIEVKSSAYLQSWAQRKLSTPRFSCTGAQLVWDEPSGSYIEDPAGRIDVWVFALQTCRDHAEYDPLSVEQWCFWAVPAFAVDELGQKTAGLKAVRELGGDGVPWPELVTAITSAARKQRVARPQ